MVDPLNPAAATVAADLGTTTQPAIAYTSAYTVGSAAYARSYDGRAMVMYVNTGKVWAVDLRTSATHVPRQLSSISNACGIVFSLQSPLLQLTADGQDAWAQISTCTGNPDVYVRSTMGSADAPVLLGFGARLLAAPEDGAANVAGVLFKDSHGLSWYSPNLVRLGDVAGATGLTTLPINAGRDYSSVTAVYLRFGNTLRRMTWTIASAVLEPSIYTFAAGPSPTGEPGWEGDRDAMYFVDGNTLLKLPSGGKPAAMATLSGTPIGLLYSTDDRIVIQQSDRTASQVLAISSIGRTGGPVTTLASSDAIVRGTTASSVLYSQGNVWHFAGADGSNDSLVAEGAIVYQRARSVDHLYVEALTTCEPDVATDKACSNGNFVQTNLLAGSHLSVGHVSHATTYSAASFRAGYDDVADTTTGIAAPATFHNARDARGNQVNTNDLYVWTPGTQSSLGRVTQHIP